MISANLLLSLKERDELIKKEPLAEKYVRSIVSSREFINKIPRFCLWLAERSANELLKMPLVYEHVKNVKKFRLKSKNKCMRKNANRPMLFESIQQHTTKYLLIPSVSS